MLPLGGREEIRQVSSVYIQHAMPRAFFRISTGGSL
jgi:hypothetical protein